MTERACVILAAGQGTRMKSPTPKVLHPVGSRAMIDRAIDAAEQLGCKRIVVVTGAHSPEVGEHVEKRLGKGSTALQDPPLGTGHAVRSAEMALRGFKGDVVVTYADTPLLDASAIEPLFELRKKGADVAVLGFTAADPGAYGRLVTGEGNELLKIVEAKDASEDELELTACNSGVLAADVDLLFELLARVTNHNAKSEYYLTDVVGLARDAGKSVRLAMASEDDVLGVNSQAELAEAERVFQRRARARAMAEGVSMTAPETVFLAWDTTLAPGVRLEPNVIFAPGVTVEEGAWIRAFSHLEGCVVRERAIVGPYARLRPGADIGADAHIGNFVEVKNVEVGAGAKANHLSYLGDGQVGAKANIGAGVIFCNYDGFEKFRTTVGAGAFVGSNSALVAPVVIGEGAYVGSGSVITEDVAPDALAIARAPQVVKPGWGERFRSMRRMKNNKAGA